MLGKLLKFFLGFPPFPLGFSGHVGRFLRAFPFLSRGGEIFGFLAPPLPAVVLHALGPFPVFVEFRNRRVLFGWPVGFTGSGDTDCVVPPFPAWIFFFPKSFSVPCRRPPPRGLFLSPHFLGFHCAFCEDSSEDHFLLLLRAPTGTGELPLPPNAARRPTGHRGAHGDGLFLHDYGPRIFFCRVGPRPQ